MLKANESPSGPRNTVPPSRLRAFPPSGGISWIS